MTESSHIKDLETDLRQNVGLVLIKPDAVNNGIAEDLIGNVFSKLQKNIPDIEMEDVIFIDSFNADEVSRIYPDLDKKYLDAHKKLFENGSLVAVFFSSESGQSDIWSLLLKIRGKAREGSGIEDSIRSILPLPGDRARFEELSRKAENETLNSDDYVDIIKNLMHVPSNVQEFIALALVVNKREKVNILTKKLGADFDVTLDNI